MLMDDRKLIEILRQAFPGIPEGEAGALIQSGRVRTYPEATVLCTEGEVEDTFYIVIRGEVRVTKFINQEQVRLLKHLYPGDFFGEMALIHNAPRAATVITTTAADVLEIKKDAFDHILRSSNSMAMAMVREVSQRLRENDEMAIQSLRSKASELTVAYQKLAEQEFNRRDLLNEIAAGLRTAVTEANRAVQIARHGLVEPVRQEAALSEASMQMQRVVHQANELFFLQGLDLVFGDFQPCDVGGMLAGLAETRPSLEIHTAGELPKIAGDPAALQRALTTLIDWAVGDNLPVQVRLLRWDAGMQLSVGLPGARITAEDAARLFTQRLDAAAYQSSPVWPVAMARQIFEQHGAQLALEHSPAAGISLRVRLG